MPKQMVNRKKNRLINNVAENEEQSDQKNRKFTGIRLSQIIEITHRQSEAFLYTNI